MGIALSIAQKSACDLLAVSGITTLFDHTISKFSTIPHYAAVLSMSRTSRVGIGGMKVWNSRDGVSARQRRRNPGKNGTE